MNELAALLSNFDVSAFFPAIKSIADTTGSFLSPVLLVMAIYIRLMETQLDGLSGGGKYGAALRDMVLWAAVLGTYYSLGALIFEFFNPIYAWLDSFGSLKATMLVFANVMAKNQIALDANGLSLGAVIGAPYAAVAMLIYYSTLVIVAFITAFLKIANVMAFGVAFIWGLIAIPISISTTFKILRGWAYLLAFALVWPIVQALLMAMFALLFTNSTDTLMTDPNINPTVMAANIMMLFAVMHLLLAAVLVAAPFIANSLVTNTPSAAGIVMPFVAAATAAGMATIKGTQAAGGGIPGIAQSAGSPSAGASNLFHTPAPRAASLSPFSPQSVAGNMDAPAGHDAASPPPAPATPAKPRNLQQQRRGVLIHQSMKTKNKP